jgi:uncharacterized protein (TIGR00369 family)
MPAGARSDGPSDDAVAEPDPVGARVRRSFERQSFMAHLGARLVRVEDGLVELEVARAATLLQQHGFLHAGVLTSLLDSACGYAALTRMEHESAVMSVEFKVNLLAPAAGESFLVRGSVLKAGRTIVVCRGEAYNVDGAVPRLLAAMQASMMAVRQREGLAD